MRRLGRAGTVLELFCRAPWPVTWATQRPLWWLWAGEQSPPASLQEENEKKSKIKLQIRQSALHIDDGVSNSVACLLHETNLRILILSGTWGWEKNELFNLWRLLLLDRRICACSCHLWINFYGSDLAGTILVKIQTSSSWAAWSWFETDSQRRDVEGKTFGRGKKPMYAPVPPVWIPYRHFSLDDLMQFTCIQQPQKLYYCRLHTVIGMCFWFSLQTIIIVLQRKMCKSSLTLHQRGFTPGTWKYYSFYDRHCLWRRKKIPAVKFTTGEVVQ